MLAKLLGSVGSTVVLGADDPRPTNVSAAVAGTVALVALLGVAAAAGVSLQAAIGLAAGAALAAGVALASGDRPVGAAVGIGLLLAGAVLFAYGSAYLTVVSGDAAAGAMTVGAGTVAYGIARFRLDAFGGRSVYAAVAKLLVAVAFSSLVLAGLIVARVDVGEHLGADAAGAVGDVVDALLEPSASEVAILEFSFLLCVTAVVVRTAVATLPIEELVPRRREDATRAALEGVNSALGVTAIASAVVLALSVAAVGNANRLETVYYDLSPTLHATASAVVESPPLRLLLARLLVVALLVSVGVKALEFAGSRLFEGAPAWLVPAVAWSGLLVAGVAVAAEPLVDRVRPHVGPEGGRILLETTEAVGHATVALFLVVLALWIVGVALLAAPVLAGLGFIPERAAGTRLAVVGTIVALVAAAGAGASRLAVIGGIAAAIVVWDVGEYGVSLREELGDEATTRRGEFVHAGASLAVGGALLFGADGFARLLEGSTLEGAIPLPALALAAVAAVAMTAVIRG